MSPSSWQVVHSVGNLQAAQSAGNQSSLQRADTRDFTLEDSEALAVRFAHQFPGHPASTAVWGMLLRRHFLTDPRAPSAAALRKSIGRVSGVPLGWHGQIFINQTPMPPCVNANTAMYTDIIAV